ncbi:MAG: hypothetical protein JO227_05065, partial [Acetobacteraceae bacterium]|nr:hypothetical protein [Acetobacteraceae bacterium]
GRPNCGVLAAPILAMAALVTMNVAAHGRVSLSPYGNMFLLARVIYDGPGMQALRTHCPSAGWRLCPFVDRFPQTSDQFLWRADSPVMLAGGHKAVSADADAIIRIALHDNPGAEIGAFVHNTLRQLTMFETGDEIHAWPGSVTPWIDRDFPPAERARYAAALQTQDLLAVPNWMQDLHAVTALIGVMGCAAVLIIGWRRRHAAAGFAAATLIAVVANAAISGGLSTPHHRYQSRAMMLAPAVALLGGAALRRSAPVS